MEQFFLHRNILLSLEMDAQRLQCLLCASVKDGESCMKMQLQMRYIHDFKIDENFITNLKQPPMLFSHLCTLASKCSLVFCF